MADTEAPPSDTIDAPRPDVATRQGPLRPRRASTVYSVRTYIFGLILAVLLPCLGFSAFLVLRSASNEQHAVASTVRDRAETASEAVDLLLSEVRGRLYGIASSETLDPAGLQLFYQRASRPIGDRTLMVSLADPEGHQVFNTAARFGDRLPMASDLAAIREVVARDLPYISNLEIDALTGAPQVTVNVPVLRDGKVVYVLSADILPLLHELVGRLKLPPDWLGLIADRAGYTIVRTRAGDRYVGELSQASFLERVRSAEHGWFRAISRDGVPTYVGFTHARLAGWSIAVGISADALLAPARRSTGLLLLAGSIILGVALLLAFIIARRISRPIVRLVADARAVGQGIHLDLHPTGLRETDAVMHSLFLAGERLTSHAAARDDAMEQLRDSEQRFRGMARELEQVNAERTRLLHGTVQAQEADRARLARELHDSLGQYLTALRLELKAFESQAGLDAAGNARLGALNALTGEVGRELNRLAWELRPTALDDFGLETSIRQLVEIWSERSSLRFDLHIDLRGGRRLPAGVETALYRVLQEAITNVVKHAAASRVAVILEASDNEVRLIVEDDGKGIAPSACRPEGGGRRLGLVGMRERLALVKGTLEVECSAGKGTTLFARVPL